MLQQFGRTEQNVSLYVSTLWMLVGPVFIAVKWHCLPQTLPNLMGFPPVMVFIQIPAVIPALCQFNIGHVVFLGTLGMLLQSRHKTITRQWYHRETTRRYI